MNEQMTPEELASYLVEMERQAINFRTSDLAEEQAVAIDFYEAKPFGDEVDGQSQVVVPVVQETVDYMTVSVLRTFVSGDKVVEFDAKEKEYEDAAEEATDAINQVFMRDQDGYKVLHNWLQTGLIERIGVTKTYCYEDTKRRRETGTVDEDELAVLMQSNDVKIIAANQNEDGTWNITGESVQTRKRYIDLPIPNYEFLFSARTRHEDESDYLCHRSRKTVSELIEMGFDRDTVDGLAAYDEGVLDSRENSTWDDEMLSANNDNIPGLRRVMLREEYARIDYDGDGVAELLRVYRVGNTILDAEEVEDQPFVVFCPFPRAHRMVGNSLADKVMDLQRNQSVIMRQTFNGFYLTNSPRMWLDESSTTDTTIEDLLTVAPGVIVRGKGMPPVPLSQPYDVSRSMALIEHLKGEQETRTGITRLNQGLDADTLNKTASGQAQLQAQGQQLEEFVARNFAEALARLFKKKLKLMIDHGEPVAIRVGGEFTLADPTQWIDDMDVLIRVGLGSGKKDQRMAYRMQLAQMQAEAFQSGTGLVDAKRLYNTGAAFVRDAQLGDPNDFFIDPDSDEAPQQQDKPDPEMMKAQAEQQLQQQKMQGEQQAMAAKIELSQQEGQAKLQLQREQAQLEAELARDKAATEADLAQQRMAQEMALAEQQMHMEAHIAAAKVDSNERVSMRKNRAGGSLAE